MWLKQTEFTPVPGIRDHMIEIAGIARANGGLVASIPGQTSAEVQIQEVTVEEYSEVLTIALSWENPEDVLVLELESPNGERITLSSPARARPLYREGPYMGFQIDQPVPGVWKLIVRLERATKATSFRLLVFSQNSRIGGGVYSPWSSYRLGDPVLLQFQCYFDRPIKDILVAAILTQPDGKQRLIPFYDDERKDARAGHPGNGLYSAVLEETFVPGTYDVRVVAENSTGTATYAETHGPDEDEPHDPYDPIPAFRREITWTFTVGESPVRSVEVKPNQGDPGNTVPVTIHGDITHFRERDTTYDFGEGIRVSDVQVIDDLTALATLNIDGAATPGFRNVIVSTDSFQEKVEEAGGFEVVRRNRSWSKNCILWLLVFLVILLTILLLIAILLLVQQSR
jgi:hypothetical protein